MDYHRPGAAPPCARAAWQWPRLGNAGSSREYPLGTAWVASSIESAMNEWWTIQVTRIAFVRYHFRVSSKTKRSKSNGIKANHAKSNEIKPYHSEGCRGWLPLWSQWYWLNINRKDWSVSISGLYEIGQLILVRNTCQLVLVSWYWLEKIVNLYK